MSDVIVEEETISLEVNEVETIVLQINEGLPGSGSGTSLPVKAGVVAGASFSGSPKKYTVNFDDPYPDTNYVILLTGGVGRTFTYETKTISGFTINANAAAAFSEEVSWFTTSIGET